MTTTRPQRLARLAREIELEATADDVRLAAIAVEVALADRTAPGIAPIAPDVLWALFHSERPTDAWELLAQMTPAQLTNQAIELAIYLERDGIAQPWGAILDCWERKLAARAELNALGEPMPASADEAAARQLVGELNEMEAMGQSLVDGRYDAKSAQIRALGYDIGPDGAGALCLYDPSSQEMASATTWLLTWAINGRCCDCGDSIDGLCYGRPGDIAQRCLVCAGGPIGPIDIAPARRPDPDDEPPPPAAPALLPSGDGVERLTPVVVSHEELLRRMRVRTLDAVEWKVVA